MENFTIYPAIDLREGRVVRLQQGDRRRETEYDTDPAAVAERWIAGGASWLHVVNLDGAFGERSLTNLTALQAILRAGNGKVRVQFGGGLRDMAVISHVLRIGASRVVVGTAAVRNPELIRSALRTFGPERVVLGVDYRDGQVQVSGWEEMSPQTPEALIADFKKDGLNTVIATNIRRDGMGTGVDISGAQVLVETTGCEVIASGGVGSLDDIQAVRDAGLSGVIVGKALYDGRFSFEEALQC
jgi:phosphoribosylformimino-5-aminoimidazole carboxamide ribotide isomerase